MPHPTAADWGKKQEGWTAWFTGLSGAGKSTLALRMGEHLASQALAYEILDGDEIRQELCRDLSFSRRDREENVRRIAYLARLLNRHGVIALVAAISPYREARDRARSQTKHFLEIHVDCSIKTAIARDVKGLYQRALNGQIPHFTGISDPYEAPLQPDVHVCTDTQSVEESFVEVISVLDERQLLPHPYSRLVAV